MACPEAKTGNRNTANVSWRSGLCNNWKDDLTINNKLLKGCLQAAFGMKHEIKLENFEYIGMNFAVVSSNFILDIYRSCIFQEPLKGLTCRLHDISGQRLECFRLYWSDKRNLSSLGSRRMGVQSEVETGLSLMRTLMQNLWLLGLGHSMVMVCICTWP